MKRKERQQGYFFVKSYFARNVDRNGKEKKHNEDNFGALINHNRTEFNCKWVRVNRGHNPCHSCDSVDTLIKSASLYKL